MMTCYASASVDEADIRRWSLELKTDAAAISCALRRPDGSLGFDDVAGRLLTAALTGQSVMVRTVNAPEWSSTDRNAAIEESIRRWAPAVVCTNPSPELLAELARTDKLRLDVKKRELLARSGRDQGVEPAPTVFTRWVTGRQQIASAPLQWLVRNSHIVSLWSHSEWGIAPILIGRDLQTTTRWVEDACASAKVPVVWTTTTASFPAW